MHSRNRCVCMCTGKWEFQVGVRKGKILGPNTPAWFISTRMYIGKWEFQISVRKEKILGPNTLARFISTLMYIGKWELQVSVRKGKILGPNMPAWFISTRMYIGEWESEFLWQFFNFVATLPRHPRAAPLAPRLKEISSRALRFFLYYKKWTKMIR